MTEILQLGDPRLRQHSEVVPASDFGSAELQAQVEHLIDTMRQANGAGLAAPQIGLMRRICVVEVTKNPRYPYKQPIPLTVFINPKITVLDETPIEVFEGCLSVAGWRGRVQRACRVQVIAQDVEGTPFQVEAEGLAAGTLQHELDHLDGQLFVDLLVNAKSLTTWANYERYHRSDWEREAEKINERFPNGLERLPIND
ncbi:MAG: peptide deformylase [Myxococcales bacterium]|nr:peptide deformylase [Myxococcales bacterium]|tara:strand:- start:902 stop:1498 length:597 start_codon:yes stop_codon:yes gene_type:complete